MLLTVVFGQPGQAVVLLVCDQVGQASEQTPAQLTFEDGVHFPQQHVFELSGPCKSKRTAISITTGIYKEGRPARPPKIAKQAPRLGGAALKARLLHVTHRRL